LPINVTLTHFRATSVSVDKQLYVPSVCVCVWEFFLIQLAKRMRRIVYCVLSGCTVIFHIISQKARISERKIIEHKICVLISSTTLSVPFIILERIERDIVISVRRSVRKVPVIAVRF